MIKAYALITFILFYTGWNLGIILTFCIISPPRIVSLRPEGRPKGKTGIKIRNLLFYSSIQKYVQLFYSKITSNLLHRNKQCAKY